MVQYVFVYFMQLINPAFKCVTIFFLSKENGKANDIIIEFAREISNILTTDGLQ